MKREVYAHNHRVSEDIYSRDSVYNYIRENSDHRITMDDVHNRLRKQGVELSHDDAVAEMIADFNREASAYVSSVHERARRDTRVVSFTSGQMRAMLDNFPEVTQMDSTHKPNQ
ncbi:hypothetical protein L916_06401 [Phytophthora nicotianae]|nr:hypothetical protein L916_06401 [Phytophthora nicotianae]